MTNADDFIRLCDEIAARPDISLNALTHRTSLQLIETLTANAADDDAAFNASMTFRNLLITMMNDDRPTLDDCDECDHFTFCLLIAAIDALRSYEYARDDITQLALNESLCPIHFIDFAICFDDDSPDCDQIRRIYPYSHDT